MRRRRAAFSASLRWVRTARRRARGRRHFLSFRLAAAGRQAGEESYAPARRGLKPVGQPGALQRTGGSEVGGGRRLWVPGTRAGEGCRVALAARPQPPPLPAQLLTDGAGEGVILHIPYSAPPPASIKLGAGGSSALWPAPVGQRSPLLWRDWLRLLPGPYDVTSAIRFVGRGDLGLGGWDEGVKVGSAGGGTEREGAGGEGGRAGAGSLPLLGSAKCGLGPGAAAAAGGPLQRPSLVRGRGAREREEILSRGMGLEICCSVSPETALAF